MPKHRTKLNLRQLAFVTEYLKNGGNGFRAALAAGYSTSCARSRSVTLLAIPKIQEMVQQKHADARMDAADIVRRYEQIATQDVRRALSWGPDGVRITPSDQLDDATALAISSVEETVDKRGNRSVKIRFHDPQRALDSLAKFQGMGHDQAPMLQQNTLNVTLGSLSTAELETVVKVLRDPTLEPLQRLLVPLLDSGQLLAGRAVQQDSNALSHNENQPEVNMDSEVKAASRLRDSNKKTRVPRRTWQPDERNWLSHNENQTEPNVVPQVPSEGALRDNEIQTEDVVGQEQREPPNSLSHNENQTTPNTDSEVGQ